MFVVAVILGHSVGIILSKASVPTIPILQKHSWTQTKKITLDANHPESVSNALADLPKQNN